MEEFKTINSSMEIEIIEKKSKFIANIFYIETENEAQDFIKSIKKKYHDARHNCFAYKLNKDEISRFSDDGEPSGTAGNPILNVIEKNNLSNVLIVVTRYFGGILLGTGGLVRAYSEAAKKVLDESNIITKIYGANYKVIVDYTEFDDFKYYCKKNNIEVENIEYLDNIICEVEMTKDEESIFIANMSKNNLKITNFQKMEEKFINKNVDI